MPAKAIISIFLGCLLTYLEDKIDILFSTNTIYYNIHIFPRFCPNDEWTLPKSFNCSNSACPVVEAILDYAKDNLVMFNIFIKDPYAKRFMKDEKITKTAYIANSGGLLGLCMGFSLVSAAEILYHCLFGLFSPICGRGKKNTKVTFG